MMLIHVDDKSNPQFPSGWHPLSEPMFHADAVVWFLVASL